MAIVERFFPGGLISLSQLAATSSMSLLLSFRGQ